jgi:hypothetical protein
MGAFLYRKNNAGDGAPSRRTEAVRPAGAAIRVGFYEA